MSKSQDAHEVRSACPGVSVATAFRPSVHGFGFVNRWRDPLLGVAPSPGRCGGMVFAALDHYLETESLSPADGGAIPAYDSPIARFIWRRQVASVATGLGINLWRFVLLTYLPARVRFGAAGVARHDALRLAGLLAEGRPVALGLVGRPGLTRLFGNHQVLAVAAEVARDRVSIGIYDPNHPGRDDVTIEVPFDEDAAIVERIGAREIGWRGLFIERYVPVGVEPDAEGALIDRAVSTRPYWIAVGIFLVAFCFFRRRRRRRGVLR